jgi:hypothetical protein
MVTEFYFCKMEGSGDWVMLKDINVLNTTDLHI